MMVTSTSSLFILADDITGAADSAARCKQAGLSATIVIKLAGESLPDGAVAVSSDSRYLSPAEALVAVQQVYGTLQAQRPGNTALCYKKIDSTLRGNIGAELAGLLAVTPAARPCAVISPAFPAQGRGLVDGYLVYEQAAPQTHHLPSLIAQQTHLPVATVGLSVVRTGVAGLAQALTTCYTQGAQLLVVDAMTERDLATLYQATRQALPQALFCGSAGLIGVMATALVAETTTAAPPHPPAHQQLDLPMLAVVGSGSNMAHRQLAQLRQQGHTHLIEVNPQQQAHVSLAADHISARWAFHLSPPTVNTILEGATARQAAAALSTAAYHAIQRHHPRTLLLVGGDTAIHLLQLMGIYTLDVEWEILPGMPVTRGRAQDGALYQIILKAGNHGDEQTLVNLFT